MEKYITKIVVAIICLACLCEDVSGWQNPGRKTYWAKRIQTDVYHASGRPSVRQLKYAYEGGFKSLIAIFNHPDTVDLTNETQKTGEYYVPTADMGKYFKGKVSALNLPPSSWATKANFESFQTALVSSQEPVLVTCTAGRTAALLTLLYLSQNGSIDAQKVADGAAEVGLTLDVAKDKPYVDLVKAVTQSDVDFSKKPVIRSGAADWFMKFWHVKNVHDNWFVVGMFTRKEISKIKNLKIKSLINLRKPTVMDGKPAQEEVSLLNVNDRTGTYDKSGKPLRQLKDVLEKNRIDPGAPESYIYDGSSKNYDSRNEQEFGDSVGYNATIEKEFMAEHNDIDYYHLPIGMSRGYSVKTWEMYKKNLMKAHDSGLVLVHCRTAYRATIWALVAVGHKNKFGSEWALTRAKQLGYDFDHLKGFFEKVLDKEEVSKAPGLSISVFSCLFALLYLAIIKM